jgi:hypothetical protein
MSVHPIKSAKKRVGISKTVRFEVFKRDSFTCQYCGRSAPEVILHVDHINPVAGGGENDVMNLVTSCLECNLGKGAKALDDHSVIAKQKAQLDELNKRREQLEMMLQWRESLANLDEEYVGAFEQRFTDVTGSTLTDVGRTKVRQWLKKTQLSDLLDALDAALDTYYKGGDPDDPEKSNQLAGKAFAMVPRIVNSKRLNEEKPWMKDLFYVRAIIRNRMYCNERVAIDLLEQAYHAGAHVDELKDWAKRARNWTNWRNEMESWIEELETAE